MQGKYEINGLQLTATPVGKMTLRQQKYVFGQLDGLLGEGDLTAVLTGDKLEKLLAGILTVDGARWNQTTAEEHVLPYMGDMTQEEILEIIQDFFGEAGKSVALSRRCFEAMSATVKAFSTENSPATA